MTHVDMYERQGTGGRPHLNDVSVQSRVLNKVCVCRLSVSGVGARTFNDQSVCNSTLRQHVSCDVQDAEERSGRVMNSANISRSGFSTRVQFSRNLDFQKEFQEIATYLSNECVQSRCRTGFNYLARGCKSSCEIKVLLDVGPNLSARFGRGVFMAGSIWRRTACTVGRCNPALRLPLLPSKMFVASLTGCSIPHNS